MQYGAMCWGWLGWGGVGYGVVGGVLGQTISPNANNHFGATSLPPTFEAPNHTFLPDAKLAG